MSWNTAGLVCRKWVAVTVGLVAAVVAAAIVTAPPASHAPQKPTPPRVAPYDIRGALTLFGPDGILVSTSDTITATGDPVCWGQRQYQDIGLGAVVTVYDDTDTVIAHGALGQGRTSGRGTPVDGSCVFPILVDDVPPEPGYYQVEIARRGTVLVPNLPTNGVVHVFAALDDEPGSPLPKVADQPPHPPISPSTP